MGIRHKIVRVLQQPSIIFDIINKINPSMARFCIYTEDLLGCKPNNIIDIGANRGTFSTACRRYFPDANIVAFEPMNKYNRELTKVANRVENIGLWNKKETLTFHELDRADVASSFLIPTTTEKYHKYKLDVDRFDNLNIELKGKTMVKIDAEGAENKILEGFGKTLKNVHILILEIKIIPEFEEQAKLLDILKVIDKYGFNGFETTGVCYEEGSKIPAKYDLIFFREDLI